MFKMDSDNFKILKMEDNIKIYLTIMEEVVYYYDIIYIFQDYINNDLWSLNLQNFLKCNSLQLQNHLHYHNC